MAKNKISLELLHKMTKALEDALVVTENMKANAGKGANVMDYVLEMSKAAGICLGIAQEATMLAGDVQMMVRNDTTGSPTSGVKSVDDLLTLLGGAGKTGGGNRGSSGN